MLSKPYHTLLVIGLGVAVTLLPVSVGMSTSEVTPPVTAPTETRQRATHLVLKLKERQVYAYKDDKVIAKFIVAVGRKGWETPTGRFQVREMIRDPIWQSPWSGQRSATGPNSPLGERWIGFWTNGKDSIGFHGTPSVNSLGKAASHGCVRMRNQDVKVLYELVQKGTPVIVQP